MSKQFKEFINCLLDPKTGVYENTKLWRYEAWIVDSVNKKAKCIGWISKEIVMVDEEFFRLWQKEVWSNFIKSGQPVESKSDERRD